MARTLMPATAPRVRLTALAAGLFGSEVLAVGAGLHAVQQARSVLPTKLDVLSVQSKTCVREACKHFVPDVCCDLDQ